MRGFAARVLPRGGFPPAVFICFFFYFFFLLFLFFFSFFVCSFSLYFCYFFPLLFSLCVSSFLFFLFYLFSVLFIFYFSFLFLLSFCSLLFRFFLQFIFDFGSDSPKESLGASFGRGISGGEFLKTIKEGGRTSAGSAFSLIHFSFLFSFLFWERVAQGISGGEFWPQNPWGRVFGNQ